MLTQGGGPAHWLRGWALARHGNPREGHRQVRLGYEIHARLDMYAGNTETLGYAAETLVLAEDWVHAERQISEALELADRIHEHVMYPYLLRLRARIALAQEGPEKARETLYGALEAARRQRSNLEEILALSELVKQGLATQFERGALRHVYDAFPEGRDLPFLRYVASQL
jgi:hypothetical protein